MQPSGRYLLFIDVLGFSELVQTQSAAQVYLARLKTQNPFDRGESAY